MPDSITERFDINYGEETKKNYINLFKKSKLNETLIKDIQNKIGVPFIIKQPFEELFTMVDYMKKYNAKLNRFDDYDYYLFLTLDEKSAKLLINTQEFPDKKHARKDIDDLEKMIKKVLEK